MRNKRGLNNVLNTDRKTLYMLLSIVMLSVLTLTVVYAALSTTLNINGNAEVSAANWDIYLDNVVLNSSSATTTAPTITDSKTATFSTTLTKPGDFYEFTIDVVNGGSIDAMIDSVTKTPSLTDTQKKYLNYIVEYQNGESITTKQLVYKNTYVRLLVKVEFRKDISASDLPTTSETLNLAFTVNYVQSDESGTGVVDNGVLKLVTANGSLEAVGTIVTIGDQQFYTIGTEGDNVKLLSMFNLYVGNECTSSSSSSCTPYGDEATGIQDSTMKGWVSGQTIRNGTTAFSYTDSTYAGSIVEGYVNNYKNIIEADYGVDVVEARLITKDELTDSETFACEENDRCSDKYPWIYSTSYWSGSANDTNYVLDVYSIGYFDFDNYSHDNVLGVRPVIIISRSLF